MGVCHPAQWKLLAKKKKKKMFENACFVFVMLGELRSGHLVFFFVLLSMAALCQAFPVVSQSRSHL